MAGPANPIPGTEFSIPCLEGRSCTVHPSARLGGNAARRRDVVAGVLKNSGGDVGTVVGSSSLGSETIKGTCQMAKLIFINLLVSDLARATAFLSGDRRRQERAVFRRYGILHGIFRYHPCDADDTRKVSAVHHQEDC
jgi:hypothetical protein